MIVKPHNSKTGKVKPTNFYLDLYYLHLVEANQSKITDWKFNLYNWVKLS